MTSEDAQLALSILQVTFWQNQDIFVSLSTVGANLDSEKDKNFWNSPAAGGQLSILIYIDHYADKKPALGEEKPMPKILDPTEGMRIGIPFRAQSTIEIDGTRFGEYDYKFPETASITLIDSGDNVADLEGYYGTAIAELTSVENTEAGHSFLTLTIKQVDIDGKLSLTRQERTGGPELHESGTNSESDDYLPPGDPDRVNRYY